MNVTLLLVVIAVVLAVGALQYVVGASQGYRLGLEEARRQRELAR